MVAPTGSVITMAELLIVRHGETEWSHDGRHTGRTDIELTAAGERQARDIVPLLAGRRIAHALVSPYKRARRTAELAGLSDYDIDPDLVEWDYGGYEGITTARIQESRPGWRLWRDGVIPGDDQHPCESVADVGERCDRVLARVRPWLGRDDGSAGDVVLVGHGHALRVLTARWLGLPPEQGALFRLDTATVSTLGFEHDWSVIAGWNAR
jgi:probable phosphoglycerate mutase